MLLDIGIKDIIDILLVATVLFYIYRLMKASRSLNIFIGIMVFVLMWLIVSYVFEMRLMGSLMNQLISVGAIGLIVLFQEEIRRFFYSLGSHRRMSKMTQWLGITKQSKAAMNRETIMPIVMACMDMAREKTGALIVIERNDNLNHITEKPGEIIDARINQELIKNIFFKNSPLHDGAMVISKKRIKAAKCTLPVSHSYDIPKEFGLRHRAAMGLSEGCDALVIVVSEETGRITVAKDGKYKVRLSAEELEQMLTEKDKEIDNQQQETPARQTAT